MRSIFKRTPKHPAVVIFVRHAATCDHRQDEAYRNCRCVKWARWSMAGQHKESTGTRSWTAAEEWRQRKQRLLDAQFLLGVTPEQAPPSSGTIAQSVQTFLERKEGSGRGTSIM